MEDDKHKKIIATGSGSLIKIEQTVMPKSWGDLIKQFEQFNADEISEMMGFFQLLEKSSSKATKKDGIPRGNALIDAVKAFRKNAASAGGKGKRGHKGSTKQLIGVYFDEFVTDKLSASEIIERSAEQLAKMIYRGLSQGGNLDRLDISVQGVDDTNVIRYTDPKTKEEKTIKPSNMANIIREIKKESQENNLV